LALADIQEVGNWLIYRKLEIGWYIASLHLTDIQEVGNWLVYSKLEIGWYTASLKLACIQQVWNWSVYNKLEIHVNNTQKVVNESNIKITLDIPKI